MSILMLMSTSVLLEKSRSRAKSVPRLAEVPIYLKPPWGGRPTPFAPIASIQIHGSVLGREASESARALLDSGADYTEIPARFAARLGLRRVGEKPIADADGKERKYPTFFARVELEGRVFEVVVIAKGFIVNGAEWALIGRDILTQAVVLNGPANVYDVAPAMPASGAP